MIDAVNQNNLLPTVAPTPVGNEPDKVKEATIEFESLFINYMLKTMRESVVKSDLLGNSRGQQIYRSMMDEELARVIARRGGIGLGEVLLRDLEEYGLGGEADGAQGVQAYMRQAAGLGGHLVLEGAFDAISRPVGLPVDGKIGSRYGINRGNPTDVTGFRKGGGKGSN